MLRITEMVIPNKPWRLDEHRRWGVLGIGLSTGSSTLALRYIASPCWSSRLLALCLNAGVGRSMAYWFSAVLRVVETR